MIIPDSILKSVEKKPTDNDKIYAAEDMYKRLKLVVNEDIPYFNFDMATLANSLELYYKGYLEASGLNLDRHLMNESHSLSSLFTEISTRIEPPADVSSPSASRDMRMFLKNLSALYIDARYNNAQISFDEFKKCFQFLTSQRNYVMGRLDPSRAWDKVNNNIFESNKLSNNIPVYEPSDMAREYMD